jgi:hypothetical protein
MAKVEIEEPEFKPVSIKLISQLEVELIIDLLYSVDLLVQESDSDAPKREIIKGLKRDLCKLSTGRSSIFKGFLTIIPEHIE